MSTVVFNSQKAQRAISTIAELVDNMSAATAKYKSIIQTAADKSNLTWVSVIVKEAEKIQESTKKLSGSMSDVQTALTRYTNEIAAYDEDTSGL